MPRPVYDAGTLHVGAPPKTIIDDGERHVVILTIWDADAETKVYWRSPDGDDRTTMSTPIRRICAGCCARADSGHVAAAPQRSDMKSRRLIASPEARDKAS